MTFLLSCLGLALYKLHESETTMKKVSECFQFQIGGPFCSQKLG